MFCRTYRFMQWSYWHRVQPCPEVLAELRAFRGLMILVFSDWWLPWSSTVLATDASEDGFAVAQSEWDVPAVKDCGRVLEKSRWRLGAAQARSHAQLTGEVDFEPHAIVDEMRALRLDR